MPRQPAARTRPGAKKRRNDHSAPSGINAEQIYAAAISGHHLLTGVEERALARRLEETEVALWKRLLDGPLGAEARTRLLALEPPVRGTSGRAARAADLDRLVAAKILGADRKNSPDTLIAELHALRNLAAEADRIRTSFVACNLRLVPSVMRRYNYQHGTNLSMPDLIQEGNLGLLKAIPRFDYRRGLRFSTFATWWIRHYLGRARQNLGAEVRVPVHLHDLAMKAHRAKVKLHRELGRDPDQAELARAMNVSEKSIRTLEAAWLKHREAIPSFDSVGEDGVTPSYLASDGPLADEIIGRFQEDDRLAAAIADMPKLLGQIVRRRFGLGGVEPETLLEIGKSMNLSRERIRQLEQKALRILRQTLDESAELAA